MHLTLNGKIGIWIFNLLTINDINFNKTYIIYWNTLQRLFLGIARLIYYSHDIVATL